MEGPVAAPRPWRKMASALLLVLFLAASGPAGSQEGGLPGDAEIDRLVDPAIRGRWASGMVVGLLDHGEMKIRGYGRFAEHPDPGGVVLQIGSVTKPFTGLMLASAVVEGRMALEDPVTRHAAFSLPEYEGTPIRLVDLATHTSGLPVVPDDFLPGEDPGNPYATYGRSRIVDFLKRYSLPRAPGSKFEYSNLGMGLLGLVLAEAQGTDYATAVERGVCGPLGLSDTRVTPTPSMRARLAGGHDEDLEPVPDWTFDGLQGCGALWSTPRDMLAFLEAWIHPERTPLNEALRLAREPHFRSGDGVAVGLGWLVKAGEGPLECDHAGGTRGYTSFVSFCPEREVGVVVLSDAAGASSIGVGIALWNRLMEGRSEPAPLPAPADLPAGALERCAGTYRFQDGSTASLEMKDGALYLRVEGVPPLRLYPQSPTRFFLRRVQVLPVYFEVEETDGRVTALVAAPDSSRDRGIRVEE